MVVQLSGLVVFFFLCASTGCGFQISKHGTSIQSRLHCICVLLDSHTTCMDAYGQYSHGSSLRFGIDCWRRVNQIFKLFKSGWKFGNVLNNWAGSANNNVYVQAKDSKLARDAWPGENGINTLTTKTTIVERFYNDNLKGGYCDWIQLHRQNYPRNMDISYNFSCFQCIHTIL